MSRVALALTYQELLERTRDRWVLVISALFALLASGVSLYGRSEELTATRLIGPSLVTLASLFVPLVALILGHDAVVGERERNTLGLLLSLPVRRCEVIVAKFVGRLAALGGAIGLGLGAALLFASEDDRSVLAQLVWPTLLLGAAFLSLGVLLSTVVTRQLTSASLVVATWFLLVFFYDLGLLGVMILSDGQVAPDTISTLVVVNPAGLFRLEMMQRFAGPEVLEGLGMAVALPGPAAVSGLWALWVLVPVALSGAILTWKKVT